MPELIILRGLPGSGKSTLANILSNPTNSVVLSIDDFFTNTQTGEYEFKYNENHLAYKYCEEAVKEHMYKNTQRIFLEAAVRSSLQSRVSSNRMPSRSARLPMANRAP